MASMRILRGLGVNISGYGAKLFGLIMLDIDATPLDNSGTKKEGVACTYKMFLGYILVCAYLGREGWCLGAALCPGDQHAQKGFVRYLEEVLKRARQVTSEPLLVRMDSAHDAAETLLALSKAEDVHFIVKWNPRGSNRASWLERARTSGKEEKVWRKGLRSLIVETHEERCVGNERICCRLIVRVLEETVDKNGQALLIPTIHLEGWLTDLDFPASTIMELYREHATCEQFHSEFKTDMDLERLPSGYFKTNALVIALGCFAYNILRAIGQIGLEGGFTPPRHDVMRRRLKTVMSDLIHVAGRVIRKGHCLLLRFSHDYQIFSVFKHINDRLCRT